MNEIKCNEIEELLVDYVDGELGLAEVAKVEGHVDRCDRCREIISDLARSLECVKGVWQENLEANDAGAGKIAAGGGKKLWFGAVGSVAAAIIVVFGLYFGGGNNVSIDQLEELVPIEQLTAQIDYEIEMAGSAARLLASAEKLAEKESLRPTAVKQYKFVADTYSGTTAAERARELIQ